MSHITPEQWSCICAADREIQAIKMRKGLSVTLQQVADGALSCKEAETRILGPPE